MTFLYPRMYRRCFPPLASMNAASPSEVTESVTMVDPGCSASTIAARSAIRRLRLNATPEPSITALRSTSVSKTTPRSAPLAFVARAALAIASGSSGLGEWFGNVPSGSRNCEPSTSAPRGSNTSVAKNPPEPFPASTAILNPRSGRGSAAPTPSTMSARSCFAYSGRKGACSTIATPVEPSSRSEGMACPPGAAAHFSAAAAQMDRMSVLSKPPSLVKNLAPLRLNGRCDAVSITAAS
mmetsp:Transcript_13857/g.59307  ORF Transcript_13857/g.59307 Transcript_13857/m.59307 type:complete len:239 (+) Transcript_13857:1501-2217(+)